MDRSRRNFVAGVSGLAAVGAGTWLAREMNLEAPPPVQSLGPSEPERPYVTEHGGVGDGVADDTEALEAAIADALGETGSLRGGRIVIPTRTYRITRTLAIEQAAGVIESAGGALVWDGPAEVPMLRLDHCQGTSISGLRFVGNASAPPSAAVSIRTLQSDPNGSHFNTLSSLRIGEAVPAGATGHQFDTGILLEGDDVRATNSRFEMISITDCATGVRITRPQYLRNAFMGLQISRCDVAFESNAGMSTWGANWVFTESALTDIALGPGSRLRVKGFDSRRSARLAMTESSSLMIRDGSWEMTRAMAADGVVISGRNGAGRSFLRLEDLDFPNNGATVAARIAWQPESQVFMHNVAGPPNRP